MSITEPAGAPYPLEPPARAASPPPHAQIGETGSPERPTESGVALASPLSARQSLALLGFAALSAIVTLGTAAASIALLPGAREYWAEILSWALLVDATATIAVIHLCLRRFGQSWGTLGFARPTKRLFHLLWQFPLGMILLITIQAITFLSLNQEPPEDTIAELALNVAPVTVLALFIAIAILTPIWEEAVFRGVIHRGFRRRLSPWAAALPSALIFAAVHGVPILLPYFITAGLILAYVSEFHRSLWGSTIFHMALNTLASITLISVLFA